VSCPESESGTDQNELENAGHMLLPPCPIDGGRTFDSSEQKPC